MQPDRQKLVNRDSTHWMLGVFHLNKYVHTVYLFHISHHFIPFLFISELMGKNVNVASVSEAVVILGLEDSLLCGDGNR